MNSLVITPFGQTSLANIPFPVATSLSATANAAGAKAVHVPVLLREVIQHLQLSPGLRVVDGTLGAGGHSREILKKIGDMGELLGFDRDPMMLTHAAKAVSGPNVVLHHGSYVELGDLLERRAIETGSSRQVDRILLDLGYSSDQLADRTRGFSFQEDGPLDLRFSTGEGLSAADWLAQADEAAIIHALQMYGEEPNALRLGPVLAQAARAGKLRTTSDLVHTVESSIPAAQLRSAEKHPATRIFQALRIQVNAELEHVERMLGEIAPVALAPGGLLAVITFHSLEDRLAKLAFKQTNIWEELTPKPIAPTPAEVRFNPRSRSAKLRVARRR